MSAVIWHRLSPRVNITITVKKDLNIHMQKSELSASGKLMGIRDIAKIWVLSTYMLGLVTALVTDLLDTQ